MSGTEDAPAEGAERPPLVFIEDGDEVSDAELLALDSACTAAESHGPVETVEVDKLSWFAEAERDLASYMERLRAAGRSAEEEDEDGADADAGIDKDNGAKQAPPAPPADADGDDKDDDDAAGQLGGGRAESYGADWEDQPLDEWMPEAITGRSRREGVTWYRVRWAGRPDETWEAEADLEEEGHLPMARAYDRARREAGKRRVAEANAGGRQGKQRKESKTKAVATRVVLPEVFDPTVYWPDYLLRIRKLFADSNLSVRAVYNICNPVNARRFLANWDETTVPAMLCHGTASHNLHSIITRGLKVPNGSGGIRVANGSAYGIGIYTSANAGYSTGYARGANYMFVCAGLVQNMMVSSVASHGNIVVFFNENLVLPCFLVEFDRSSQPESTPIPYKENITEEFLERLAAGSVCSSSLYDQLRARYTQGGLRAAGLPPPIPSCIKSGSRSPGVRYDQSRRTLTKKQLRAEPRAAKEVYKMGVLVQKKK